MKETCSACRFYIQWDDKCGTCRVNPPIVQFFLVPTAMSSSTGQRGITFQDVSGWPEVKTTDWCSEYTDITYNRLS